MDVTLPVGFDYSADLEEIKSLLESVETGLVEVHTDLTQIIFIVIAFVVCLVLWTAIFKHMS